MVTTLDGIRDIKVYQNKSGYRFSVDALLLSSFVNVKLAARIVDLGAGSGIIGLLLANKYPDARISLVELQESLCRLAHKNIGLNRLEARVQTIRADIKDLPGLMLPMTYEIAVSNPPFRKTTSGRLCAAEEKAIARHEIKLGLTDVVGSAAYLLKPRGRFFMIYHPERLLELIESLKQNRLEPKRMRFIHNDSRSASKIVLIESVKEGRAGLKIEKPLFLYNDTGGHTEEVQEMYGNASDP